MYVGEFGVLFRLGVGYNLSSATTLTLTFTKPDRTTLVVTNPAVRIGNTPINTSVGAFAANTYVTYTFVHNDVTQAGLWSVVLTYDDATPKHLFSKISHFQVNRNS